MSDTAPPRGSPAFWDARYAEDGAFYGEAPNVFLAEMAPRLPKGRAFLPADGQGRNGLFLAQHGWDVTTVDLSPVAVARARETAAARGLMIDARAADLLDEPPAEGGYDVVAVFYLHVPTEIRRPIYASLARAVAPGGMLIVEGFSPRTATLPEEGRSHGPSENSDVVFTPDIIAEEFAPLTPIVCEEADVILHEGPRHDGRAIVTRGLFRRD